MYQEVNPNSANGGKPVQELEVRRRPSLCRSTNVRALEGHEIARAKRAFATRRVADSDMKTVVTGAIRPRTGDLVLARVDRILFQTRVELISGRKAGLTEGDTIIVAYGDRYATDQFESEVPLDLGPTNLVAVGGVASKMLSRNSSVRGATEITPIGLIGDVQGRPLNLYDFRLDEKPLPDTRPRTIAVLGTSMNSGKTTTVRSLVTGLGRAGYKVGTAKVTGTGSGGDFWAMIDAGAAHVVDFTDAGYSATYKVPLPELEAIMRHLISHLTLAGADIILLEIADGIFQEQNIDLIQSPAFHSMVDSVFFASGEALGAALGVCKLQMLGFDVSGLSGKLTASELLIREAKGVCETPIYRKADLCDPTRAPIISGLVEGSLEVADTDQVEFEVPLAPEHLIDFEAEAAAPELQWTDENDRRKPLLSALASHVPGAEHCETAAVVKWPGYPLERRFGSAQ